MINYLNFFENKSILVTGAVGTVGKALVDKLANLEKPPRLITGIDNNESNLFFAHSAYSENDKVNFFLCDIRNYEDINRLCRGVDIVLHAAALKHVVINEYSPEQAVQTNIIGTQNIIRAAEELGIERVIFTSSDKAVNPTNVMGTSKLMGERLITAANAKNTKTIFASTRFGNVLGSNGSVVEIFKKQLAERQPLTITDERMSRFVMSIDEAADLVLESVFLAKGGEVLITKMPVVKIPDLASALTDLLKERLDYNPLTIQRKIIGLKAGEKMYEELMSEEETFRAVELDRYFVVIPAFKALYRPICFDYDNVVSSTVVNPYNSNLEKPAGLDEVKSLLIKYNLVF